MNNKIAVKKGAKDGPFYHLKSNNLAKNSVKYFDSCSFTSRKIMAIIDGFKIFKEELTHETRRTSHHHIIFKLSNIRL